MGIRGHNRRTWDVQMERGNIRTVPVSAEAIADAQRGRQDILLTPAGPVPQSQSPLLDGLDMLCLASGGGQ